MQLHLSLSTPLCKCPSLQSSGALLCFPYDLKPGPLQFLWWLLCPPALATGLPLFDLSFHSAHSPAGCGLAPSLPHLHLHPVCLQLRSLPGHANCPFREHRSLPGGTSERPPALVMWNWNHCLSPQIGSSTEVWETFLNSFLLLPLYHPTGLRQLVPSYSILLPRIHLSLPWTQQQFTGARYCSQHCMHVLIELSEQSHRNRRGPRHWEVICSGSYSQ